MNYPETHKLNRLPGLMFLKERTLPHTAFLRSEPTSTMFTKTHIPANPFLLTYRKRKPTKILCVNFRLCAFRYCVRAYRLRMRCTKSVQQRERRTPPPLLLLLTMFVRRMQKRRTSQPPPQWLLPTARNESFALRNRDIYLRRRRESQTVPYYTPIMRRQLRRQRGAHCESTRSPEL